MRNVPEKRHASPQMVRPSGGARDNLSARGQPLLPRAGPIANKEGNSCSHTTTKKNECCQRSQMYEKKITTVSHRGEGAKTGVGKPSVEAAETSGSNDLGIKRFQKPSDVNPATISEGRIAPWLRGTKDPISGSRRTGIKDNGYRNTQKDGSQHAFHQNDPRRRRKRGK